MTPQQAKELLPIIIAFAEGKTIQIKHISQGWIDTKSLYFDSVSSDYRIKPEPREFWIVNGGEAYESLDRAIKRCNYLDNLANGKYFSPIHVKETLSD